MLRARILLSVAVVSVVMTTFGSVPARAVDCSPWDYICQQLAQAQNDQAAAQQQLERIQKRIQDVQQQSHLIAQLITQLDGQIKTQQKQIDATQARIDDLDRQIRFVVADIGRRETHLAVREDLFAQRVRSMDKHGTVNYFELVVTSTSFNQLVDRLLVMQEVVRADRKMLDDLRQQRAEVDKLKLDLGNKRADEASLLQQQRDQKAQLEQTRATEQAALEYQRQLAAQLQQYAQELSAELAAIKVQVAQLEQEYQAELQQAGGGNGQFVWPETLPRAPITQGFGCTDFAGEPPPPGGIRCPLPYFHYGIDIADDYGTPVLAGDAGVAETYPGAYGYGNYVIVLHGNGYYSLYGHLAGFAVGNGAIVRRGQPIGYEGSTGFSTGPHLHFGIWYNDYPVNPCSYVGC